MFSPMLFSANFPKKFFTKADSWYIVVANRRIIMKTTTVTLNNDECATILVGLTEFSFLLESKSKKSCLKVYDETNEKLIEKFRKICFDLSSKNNLGGCGGE